MSTQNEKENAVSALQSFFHLKIVLQLRIHSCNLATHIWEKINPGGLLM